ncbi:MAG: hypothetical protein Q7K45_04530, partial [Nanoarchaeota archaeon]|nr:hypothetical protein [Nanoarchaeota archaeon]
MFGKFKDKLKSALSIFSKKAEEVAEEKVVEAPLEVIPDIKPEKITPAAKPKEVVPKVKPKEVITKEEKKGEEKKKDKVPETKKEVFERKPEPKKVPENEIIQKKKEIMNEIGIETKDEIEKGEIKEKPLIVETKEEII